MRLHAVGPLSGLDRTQLEGTVRWTSAEPADSLPAFEDSSSAEALLIDEDLEASSLRRLIEKLPPPESPHRPAVLVWVRRGGPTDLGGWLGSQVDDFVSAAAGSQELIARVHGALRTRRMLAELSRKNEELASLYGKVESMAQRMAEELHLAARVQRSLLPPPTLHARLELAREFIPFREIGGDYYDLVPLGEGRLAVAIGDVMGKGVPAALLAANLKACLHAHVQAGAAAPEEVVARVNRLFWEVSPKGLFASLFFGVFDLECRQLDYVNAGHEHPFVVASDGTVRGFDEGGTVLGVVEKASYQRGRVRLERGDVLVFYSDGVTDRTNRSGEMYGRERLVQSARRVRGDDARLALYSLLGELQGWAAGVAAQDDITLVVGKVR